MKKQYEQLCDDILYNSSQPGATSVHPLSGGIYCDACPPSEFAETAANQSARFLGTARQPEAEQTAAVAGVLLAAADKLGAGLLHRFHAQWEKEEFTVIRISVERCVGNARPRSCARVRALRPPNPNCLCCVCVAWTASALCICTRRRVTRVSTTFSPRGAIGRPICRPWLSSMESSAGRRPHETATTFGAPGCLLASFAACLDALPATPRADCSPADAFVYCARIGSRQAAASSRGD
jgi:hypothetical protein